MNTHLRCTWLREREFSAAEFAERKFYRPEVTRRGLTSRIYFKDLEPDDVIVTLLYLYTVLAYPKVVDDGTLGVVVTTALRLERADPVPEVAYVQGAE